LSPEVETKTLNELDVINIILVILKAANERTMVDETRKTEASAIAKTSNIIYTTLFNSPKLKVYWDALIQKGLLAYDPDIQRFITTAQGRAFFQAYSTLDYDVIKKEHHHDEITAKTRNKQLK
jgi:predicted transcriptional regulator